MKSLLTIAILFFSVNSQANVTLCTDTNKAGDTVAVKLDTNTVSGEVKMVSAAKGVAPQTYTLHIYVMNDNSPGFYYYEGLAYAPNDPTGPKFFRIKLSNDDLSAKMVISHIGGGAIATANLSSCAIPSAKSARE